MYNLSIRCDYEPRTTEMNDMEDEGMEDALKIAVETVFTSVELHSSVIDLFAVERLNRQWREGAVASVSAEGVVMATVYWILSVCRTSALQY
ncbi:hypothetical protein J6590_034924 [Homalodisca vitripennis]|nr:hypothetical protein J6590_034924 [Homalodisca vitripennis]